MSNMSYLTEQKSDETAGKVYKRILKQLLDSVLTKKYEK